MYIKNVSKATKVRSKIREALKEKHHSLGKAHEALSGKEEVFKEAQEASKTTTTERVRLHMHLNEVLDASIAYIHESCENALSKIERLHPEVMIYREEINHEQKVVGKNIFSFGHATKFISFNL